jgi:hypothetical protein
MESMESLINTLPPELIRQKGRRAVVTLISGEEEEFLYLGKHKDALVVSREPYVALKPYRDIQLLRSSHVAEVRFLDPQNESV